MLERAWAAGASVPYPIERTADGVVMQFIGDFEQAAPRLAQTLAESALRFGAKGIKVRVSGRLNGAEIARSEWYLHGQLPLQTLRFYLNAEPNVAAALYELLCNNCVEILVRDPTPGSTVVAGSSGSPMRTRAWDGRCSRRDATTMQRSPTGGR
mgnify:CR=1 FL=1